MPLKDQDPKIHSRTLARLISNAGFSKMVLGDGKSYARQLKNVVIKGGISLPKKCSLKQLLDLSYNHLQYDYRHEYIYKTKLLSDFILKEFSLTDTIILNEFRIGKSIADMVLVNGTNKVFEIKTELDSPERLKTQLNDYYKAFSEVYIVTHHSLSEKYRAIVDSRIGIIEFTSDNSFQKTREAKIDLSKLDNLVMMKTLRKGEFLHIIEKIYGHLPQTSQVKLYSECLELASQINPIELQKYFLNVIKSRINFTQQLVQDKAIPEYLKFFCYLANISENQYLVLPSKLSCLV